MSGPTPDQLHRSAVALLGAAAVVVPAPSPGADGDPIAGPAPDAQPPEVEAPADTVEMTDRLTFAPDTVRIRAGRTVTFRNTSALVHTVTGDPARASLEGSVRLPEGAEPFHSGRLEPGGTFRHTFEVPGRYRYFCVPHEGAKMRGTVIVERAVGARLRPRHTTDREDP